MIYRFKYRRKLRLFARRFKVIGHRYDQEQNKIVLFMPDGGQREIFEWDKCAVILGADWVLAVKKSMEKQAGQSIPLSVG